MQQHYFIVLDSVRHNGNSPKYDLCFGNPDDAIGVDRGSARTVKALVRKVPAGEKVYRVYLQRTDGREGKKELVRK